MIELPFGRKTLVWVSIATAAVLLIAGGTWLGITLVSSRMDSVSSRSELSSGTSPGGLSKHVPASANPSSSPEALVDEPSAEPVEPPMAAPGPAPAPALPAAPELVCPVGHLSGGVISASAAVGGYNGMTITVVGYVRNDSNRDVVLWRDDTPDVKGYTAAGAVSIINLFGTWANTERDAFKLPPGATIQYTQTWSASLDQLKPVVALYAAPEVGGLNAIWPSTAELAGCARPLANAGQGADFRWHI
jgi:hypothetical protein